MPEAGLPGEPLLVIEDVYAGYGGGDVLRGVSFPVLQGGVTCVVGPNGAGKSTLLAAISGVLAIRTGEIRFRGRSIVGRSPGQILREGVVQVPQSHSLFPEMSVRANVEMGGFILRDRALVQRRLVQLQDTFPLIRDRATAKAGTLSGGQQRLVEFARCLMLDPALVILDEPSMGLDPKTRRTVFDSIRLMHQQGRTILLVEQNARAGLRLSTHGVVLETGRVRLSGTGEEVLNHPEIGELYLGGARQPTPYPTGS
ncbi:MAG TPA: ABC transporter ATP-binding protein [Candidatus Micrarchaeaceae archaeon]|nr:ABC transporter ATP-binding protein [Candidatus Micrarchaeaceae archaeon]